MSQKLFGTDGIRGRAFVKPLDETTLCKLGVGLATILKRRSNSPRILLAGDTRFSTTALAEWLGGSFISGGGQVIWGEVLPTPAVSHILRDGDFHAGVVISASHNPAHDNGIKVLGSDGEKLNDADERLLEEAIAAANGIGWSPLPAVDSSLSVIYEDRVCATHRIKQPLDGMKVVVDSANGAASGIASRVLQRLGATVVEMAAAPDGGNINRNCGATAPQKLAELVIRESADAGLALDGDGDRGVLVDERGTILDGDDILLAWAKSLHAENALPGGKVVATVMSNLGLERALSDDGLQTIRCPVGDRAVWATMRREGAVLGGEQSGHIICSHHAVTGDGLLTGSHLLAIANARQVGVSELSNITRLPQVLVNVEVARKMPFSEITTLQDELQETEQFLDGRGRILLRYSGTEALARVMVEGDDQDEIEGIANRLADILKAQLC